MSLFNDNYEKLMNLYEEISHLESISSIAEWDKECYIPRGASQSRGKDCAALAGVIHEKWNNIDFEEYLTKCESHIDEAAEKEKTIIHLIRKDMDKRKKIPGDFVKKMSNVKSEAHRLWIEARDKKDFSLFKDILHELVELQKQYAQYLSPDNDPYNTLMDLYEPDLTVNDIDNLFTPLKEAIVPLVREINSKNSTLEEKHAIYPKANQMELCHRIAEKIGFDFHHGRLDESVHPFTIGISPYDVRITTRFNETSFTAALLGLIHEAGHGMYEQGLPKDSVGTPICRAASTGIHESQSLFWEKRVGTSLAFIEDSYTELKQAFPEQFENVNTDDLYQKINKVSPSLNRVEADEVTYCLHIMIRYEIEKDIFNGSLKIEDIPEAWNAKYQEYLGVTPPSDLEGCLQDIHWAIGAFGYFPSYALGHLYASQMYEAAEKEIGNIQKLIAQGEYNTILSWLRKSVHQHGRQYNPNELITTITGNKLSSEAYIKYITNKYRSLYSL